MDLRERLEQKIAERERVAQESENAWRYNARLHNEMRREIQRVATYAAAHERTYEWISDRLIDILGEPKAWMEPAAPLEEADALAEVEHMRGILERHARIPGSLVCSYEWADGDGWPVAWVNCPHIVELVTRLGIEEAS